MGKTAGDYLCERLLEWDVSTIYGFPGDGINRILGVLRRYEDRLRFIQTRHEEMAAFMACGHAKYTGEVGVCLATGGPGPIHLLNGLYDAKLDHQPVVATVGQTCVIIPSDVQEMDAVEKQPHLTHTMHSGVGYWPGRVIPKRHDLRAAADILNAGEKVAMLVGQGAFHATDEIIAVADTLGAGVAKALLGKAAVPDDVPFCTGSIGLLGTRPSWDMMQGADTLLMVGSSFPYSEFLPEEGKVKGVQIDLLGRMLSIRYPMDLALVGDSKQTLAELLPLLHRKTDRSWQEGIVKGVEQWWRLMDDRAKPADIDRDGDRPRVRPQALFAELSRQLPDNAILSSDSGSAANWFARHVKIRRGMKASLSGNLATMVPGVPYAIAAKFAFPDRVAVAMVGDGAMQMGGMAEMLTAAKYYKTWTDPRLVVLVLNNEDLNQVTWEQRAMVGDPKFHGSQDIPYVPYHAYAEMVGLRGIKVDRSDQIEGAWREALSADRPVIIDALTDPEEPPIPPHVSFAQMAAMTKAFVAAPKEGLPGAVAAVREFATEFLPGR